MRAIVCTLWQNLGTIGAGASNTISTKLVKIGTLESSIDDQLTKMQPGDLTVELIDPDDSIWTFIQTQLALTNPNGLLPPWLQLSVGGVQMFLGTVDPSKIVRHLASDKHSIELGAQDWSMMLSGVYLGSPSAALWQSGAYYALATQVLSYGQVYQCTSPGTSTSTGAPTGQTTFSDGSLTWSWIQPSWVRAAPRWQSPRVATSPMTAYSTDLKSLAYGAGYNAMFFAGAPNQVRPGDTLTFTSGGLVCDAGDIFAVQYVQGFADSTAFNTTREGGVLASLPAGAYTYVLVAGTVGGGSPWFGDPLPDAATLLTMIQGYVTNGRLVGNTFTRASSSYTDLVYYTVQTAATTAPNVYTIDLDTVDGMYPLDVLECIHGNQNATWTILSVDPELNRVTVKEAVTNLSIGDKIYFDDATNAEMVMMDPRTLIQMAASPNSTSGYSVDFSRFTKATLPLPVFGWLPPAPFGGTAALLPVSDIEPSSTGAIRVICGLQNAAHGSPDAGWTAEAATTAPTWQTQHADWTGQKTSAPSSLMPYTLRADAPYAQRRNRAYHDFTYHSVDNGPIPTAGAQSTWMDPWTPAIGNTVPALIFYDYLAMRKIVVTSAGTVLNAYAWSGSAFGGASGLTWPTMHPLTSICNFPGGPANSLLGTTPGQLELALFTGLATCAIPGNLVYSVLVPTPYGPYLVGPNGYGKITYSGGVLSVASASFPQLVTCLWPNTFVARSATEAVVLGRVDTDFDAAGKPTTTESWLFRLTLPPNQTTVLASIILSEKIADGAPIFAGAMLDPTKAGRVVGHFGGCLWQYDTQMPWTVERFTPGGMTAQECIEHICQLNNAIAAPQPSGTLAIVSRGISESPTALTVSQVSREQVLSWPNFYSIVRTSTQSGDLYYDAYGAQNGGNLLEISNQPMLWSLSQAGAMAESYAAWFGVPRVQETQKWVYNDPNSAPPWEGLPPFAKVTVNGSSAFRVMSTSQDFIEGTCSAILVGA